MNARELIAKLTDAGLIARYLGGVDERIMGATSSEAIPLENGDVIDLYQNAFTISRVPEGWMVLVPLAGQLIQETQVPDLEQALTVVLEEYGIIEK